jgi:hypothetical protein
VPGVAAAALGRQGLDDEERGGEHDDQPVGGEEPEDAAPRHEQQQLRPDERSQDRREPVDECQARQHPHQGQPAEQVAHDRHRDDAACGGTGAL